MSFVRQVFNKVATKYDLMNDLMSFGLHRIWKRKLIHYLQPRGLLLDVAGGTGDIAVAFLKAGGERAIVCDINQNMLNAGLERNLDQDLRYLDRLEWIVADAVDLPFSQDHFDCYTISFGIRNIQDKRTALMEAFRTLKPDGQFACMEFVRSDLTKLPQPINWIYQKHSQKIIPALGELIVGNAAPYEYLVNSIKNFMPEEEFTQLLKLTGFSNIKVYYTVPAVAAIYLAFKPT